MPGLEGERLKVARSCLLNNGFKSDGQVELSGADIGGELSFEDAVLDGQGQASLRAQTMTVGSSLFLSGRFTARGTVDLTSAHISGQLICTKANFDGLENEAISAQDIKISKSLFLNDGFTARGTVDLGGANISGQLNCEAGTFDGLGEKALDCQSMVVEKAVFLDDEFSSKGLVDLASAKIAGALRLTGGHFDGQNGSALDLGRAEMKSDVLAQRGLVVDGRLDFSGAKVSGNVEINGPKLTGDFFGLRLRVAGTFYWKEVSGKIPLLDLEDAEFGKLEDDRKSWDVAERYYLNGLRYGATGPAMSVRARLNWLDKNSSFPDKDEKDKPLPSFDPQPYSQLAKVMDGQGHRRSAARVLFEREKRLRRTEHKRAHVRVNGDVGPAWDSFRADLLRVADLFFGVLFGFGHRPLRGLVASSVIIVMAGALYGWVYNAGQMAPASDVVITSEGWIAAVTVDNICPLRGAEDRAARMAQGCLMPLEIWTGAADGFEPAASATDYETFNRWLYGLDLFVPLDALGQENAWAPSKDRGWWGFWGYYLRWAFQTMGWVITALGAATLTGLVGRRD